MQDGYFTPDQVGDDLAPRLIEWLSHHRTGTGGPGATPDDPVEIAGIAVVPDRFLDFFERCVTGDENSIRSIEPLGTFISRAAFAAGVDLFVVWDECSAKRQILRNYRGAKDRLKAWESLQTIAPEEAENLDVIRGYLTGAQQALIAVARTYRDRYGFGKAMRGVPVEP